MFSQHNVKKIGILVGVFFTLLFFQNCKQGFDSGLPQQVTEDSVQQDPALDDSNQQEGESNPLPEGDDSATDPIEEEEPGEVTSPEPEPEPEEEVPVGAISNIRMFIFGHSLINHEHTPSPTEEKKVPHWLAHMARTAGRQYAADGQYGFLRNHADFSTINAQWSFQQVDQVWSNSGAPFSAQDYNMILSTPANFIQWQTPTTGYWDDPSVSPVSATLQILDQSRAAHPGIPFYIYENWPDMGDKHGTYPSVNLSAYHSETRGAFHQWFLDYHDAILAARPGSDVRMIPVGPALADVLSRSPYSSIPVSALYEDDAPHGQPTIYFLASLVTYMGIYQSKPPSNLSIPSTVHSTVRNNYQQIVDIIWNHLQNFNDGSGNSRVF